MGSICASVVKGCHEIGEVQWIHRAVQKPHHSAAPGVAQSPSIYQHALSLDAYVTAIRETCFDVRDHVLL